MYKLPKTILSISAVQNQTTMTRGQQIFSASLANQTFSSEKVSLRLAGKNETLSNPVFAVINIISDFKYIREEMRYAIYLSVYKFNLLSAKKMCNVFRSKDLLDCKCDRWRAKKLDRRKFKWSGLFLNSVREFKTQQQLIL